MSDHLQSVSGKQTISFGTPPSEDCHNRIGKGRNFSFIEGREPDDFAGLLGLPLVQVNRVWRAFEIAWGRHW
jgi:hypothetical protein